MKKNLIFVFLIGAFVFISCSPSFSYYICNDGSSNFLLDNDMEPSVPPKEFCEQALVPGNDSYYKMCMETQVKLYNLYKSGKCKYTNKKPQGL